jgi:hypothetical protein
MNSVPLQLYSNSTSKIHPIQFEEKANLVLSFDIKRLLLAPKSL